MVTVLVISRHTPADCAVFNEKSRKIYAEFMSKKAELLAKHGVKEVGAWVVPSEHFIVQVLEAPNFEVLQAYSMEPENTNMMNWNIIEFKVAQSAVEAPQWMMQAQ